MIHRASGGHQKCRSETLTNAGRGYEMAGINRAEITSIGLLIAIHSRVNIHGVNSSLRMRKAEDSSPERRHTVVPMIPESRYHSLTPLKSSADTAFNSFRPKSLRAEATRVGDEETINGLAHCSCYCKVEGESTNVTGHCRSSALPALFRVMGVHQVNYHPGGLINILPPSVGSPVFATFQAFYTRFFHTSSDPAGGRFYLRTPYHAVLSPQRQTQKLLEADPCMMTTEGIMLYNDGVILDVLPDPKQTPEMMKSKSFLETHSRLTTNIPSRSSTAWVEDCGIMYRGMSECAKIESMMVEHDQRGSPTFLDPIKLPLFFLTLYAMIFKREMHKNNLGIFLSIVLMYTLSTVHVACRWLLIKNAFVDHADTPESTAVYLVEPPLWLTVFSAVVLTVNTLAADCVLIWRCWTKWNRHWLIVLLPIICTLVGAALGFRSIAEQAAYVMNPNLDRNSFIDFATPYFSLSLATTCLAIILIILRIINMTEPSTRRAMGYGRVVEMVVESAMLYSVTLIIFLPLLVTESSNDGYAQAVVAQMTSNHILTCSLWGIAPTLIVARVTFGLARPDET
ncbi:hypothetical protein DFH09DRAFT_1444763 [Mycena vulgaris]|nr:hypothetical protein DFH09DRAFT_1444763 [Mycena vulgaris]